MTGDRQYDNLNHYDSLVEAIIQTEAEIEKAERQKTATEKRMKQIRNSNTFKTARLLKKIVPQNKSRMELERLQKELETTREALQKTRMELELSKLDDRTMNSIKIQRSVRGLKDEAALLEYIKAVIGQKRQHDENYIEALTYAGRLFMNSPQEYRHLIYSKLLEGMKIEDIPEFMMREVFVENPLQLKQAASFRASLNMRIRKSQLGFKPPEYILDDKQVAYTFVDKLNIRRPWIADKTYTVDSLPFESGKVVKPVDGAGARGVYIIHGTNDIIDLKHGRKLASFEELSMLMKEDLGNARVSRDEWMLEELIVEDDHSGKPASDIKFYCFYGKVGLVLEISRYPELKYCWWTPEGQRVTTGKYDHAPFKGTGVGKKEVEMAENMSSQIPAPFIRIDFLRSNKGLVFGEFTPKPGNYSDFDTNTDQRLGDLFLEAENRLDKDYASQKDFRIFKTLDMPTKNID